MARYQISFPTAGAYVFTGGLDDVEPLTVAGDGQVTDEGRYSQFKELSGGHLVVEVRQFDPLV